MMIFPRCEARTSIVIVWQYMVAISAECPLFAPKQTLVRVIGLPVALRNCCEQQPVPKLRILLCALALAGANIPAVAAECAGNPDVLGTSRIVTLSFDQL